MNRHVVVIVTGVLALIAAGAGTAVALDAHGHRPAVSHSAKPAAPESLTARAACRQFAPYEKPLRGFLEAALPYPRVFARAKAQSALGKTIGELNDLAGIPQRDDVSSRVSTEVGVLAGDLSVVRGAYRTDGEPMDVERALVDLRKFHATCARMRWR